MNKEENIILINGVFHHDEVKDMVMNLFSAKMNFLRLKNLSAQERFGKGDVSTQTRITELQKEIEKFQKTISEAKAIKKPLTIRSEVNISIDQ